MILVGLTGGIGAGKSTVSAMLAGRGAVVIDADAIAREVVEPGTPTLAKLVERFGPEIVRDDGSLDRAALAAVAFKDDETRKELEAITHPAIGEEFLRRVAESPPNAVVSHDVPLLVESKRGFQYAEVIVVEAPLETRLDRVESRGVPRDDARRRIELQATDDERRAVATFVVDNAGDLDALEAQLRDIWAALERRAEEAADAEREAARAAEDAGAESGPDGDGKGADPESGRET
jgi:dephospho-CoA kinase